LINWLMYKSSQIVIVIIKKTTHQGTIYCNRLPTIPTDACKEHFNVLCTFGETG
jgi:hypothetical protein